MVPGRADPGLADDPLSFVRAEAVLPGFDKQGTVFLLASAISANY
jgi:hypothetical protein